MKWNLEQRGVGRMYYGPFRAFEEHHLYTQDSLLSAPSVSLEVTRVDRLATGGFHPPTADLLPASKTKDVPVRASHQKMWKNAIRVKQEAVGRSYIDA